MPGRSQTISRCLSSWCVPGMTFCSMPHSRRRRWRGATLRVYVSSAAVLPCERCKGVSFLKVLEMTAGQIKTMSETVLGLRHGPMAALDKETLFICFVSGDKRRALYARDLLQEIGEKDVVAERIAVGPESAENGFLGYCDFYLPINAEVDDAYRPVLDVIFGQLLAPVLLGCPSTEPRLTKRRWCHQPRCSKIPYLLGVHDG